MGRNSHKSCYHGAMLQELEISYLYPQPETKLGINGGITPESVEKMLLHNQGIQAVMITSPTYDGVVSDVKEIAERVHAYGIPLIVDEAHGAHFGFHPFFPESSVKLGADIVIHSLHKTLPSLTQTALLHVNGNLVDRERLNWYLGVYQTSSPSYVFMAGMDRCVHLIENEGMQLFEKFSENLEEFYTEAAYFRKIRTVGRDLAVEAGIYDFDRSKLVLSVRNTDLDGHRLQQILRVQYQLELEMAAGSYGLAITSILDSKEGFKRMLTALGDIDIQCRGAEESPLEDTVIRNTTVMSVFEALEEEKEAVQIKNAGGRIAGEFIYLYPPGIPLLVPGERIGKELAERLQKFRKHGYSLQGLADYNGCDIRVMK